MMQDFESSKISITQVRQEKTFEEEITNIYIN